MLRLRIKTGVDASLTTPLSGTPGPNVALSPDGTTLAFVAQKGLGSYSELYVRRLDRLEAIRLEGTQDASGPFFSPDGRWIAFFADGSLKKIAVAEGNVATLCDAANVRNGYWAEDGTIVLSSDAGVLTRISSSGSFPEPLTTPAENETAQLWPQVLPGGRAILYTSVTRGADQADVVVQQLPRGVRKVVRHGGYFGRYLRSGHLIYVRDGTLFAEAFDIERLESVGRPAAVIARLTDQLSSPTEAPALALAETGTLVHVPAAAVSEEQPIESFDKAGTTTILSTQPLSWSNPRFSPDGRRLAFDVLEGKQLDVWIYEMEGGSAWRLTLDSADDTKPVWTPDGRRMVFASRRGDMVAFNLYWERTDGSGEIERLTTSHDSEYPASWHPTGKFLAYQRRATRTNFDIWLLPFEGTETSSVKLGKPMVFLDSPFDEREPMFSPDGRWLAYQSNETGRDEVYVRPFVGKGGPWQISTTGGVDPMWSRTRPEILFSTPDGRIMTASYTVDHDSLRVDKPKAWSRQHFSRRARLRSIDLHPDGNRIVGASVLDATEAQNEIVFVIGLFDELSRIAPVSK